MFVKIIVPLVVLAVLGLSAEGKYVQGHLITHEVTSCFDSTRTRPSWTRLRRKRSHSSRSVTEYPSGLLQFVYFLNRRTGRSSRDSVFSQRLACSSITSSTMRIVLVPSIYSCTTTPNPSGLPCTKPTKSVTPQTGTRISFPVSMSIFVSIF